MKISFRIKVLLLYYKFLYKKLYESPLVKIGESGNGVKNILFFLPSEKKFAQVISHFIKKYSNNTALNFKYVLYEKSMIYYQDIPKSHLIIFTDNDINLLGAINNKSIIESFDNARFDALVDLNQSPNQSLSLLSLQLKIPIKVGFQSPISDELYSIVIQPAKDSFLESNYQLIENILGIS